MAHGRKVRVGTVNRHAVMRHEVARLQQNGRFAHEIIGGVVGNALRETENLRTRMRAKAAAMRAGNIPETAVFRLNLV